MLSLCCRSYLLNGSSRCNSPVRHFVRSQKMSKNNPKMSAMQNEVNKKTPKTYSMSEWKTKSPTPGLCLRRFPLICLIYSLVQLVSVLRSCVAILSVFFGDLMSFVKTHPSGSGGCGLIIMSSPAPSSLSLSFQRFVCVIEASVRDQALTFTALAHT